MKSAEHRDQMVAKVQEAFGKWPSLNDMPVVTVGDDKLQKAEVEEPTDNQQNYLAALYELCGKGATPTGRYESGGTIVGEGEWPKEEAAE